MSGEKMDEAVMNHCNQHNLGRGVGEARSLLLARLPGFQVSYDLVEVFPHELPKVMVIGNGPLSRENVRAASELMTDWLGLPGRDVLVTLEIRFQGRSSS